MIDIFKLQDDNVVKFIRVQLKHNIKEGFDSLFVSSFYSCMNFFTSLSKKRPEFAIIMQIGDEYKLVSLIYDPNVFISYLDNHEMIKQSKFYRDICKYVTIQSNQPGQEATKLYMCRLAGKVRPSKNSSSRPFIAKYMLYFKRLHLPISALAFFHESNSYVLIDTTTYACLPFDIFTKNMAINKTYYIYDSLFSVDELLADITRSIIKGGTNNG